MGRVVIKLSALLQKSVNYWLICETGDNVPKGEAFLTCSNINLALKQDGKLLKQNESL